MIKAAAVTTRPVRAKPSATLSSMSARVRRLASQNSRIRASRNDRSSVQVDSSTRTRHSLFVTSNKPFGRWDEVFGDDVVAAVMIDRLVHHAEVIAMA